MKTFKLLLMYQGKNYVGWQRQKNGVSIQETLENSIYQVTGFPSITHAASRTDAGVHAEGQVVSFQTSSILSENKLLQALNATLPSDIAVKEMLEVPASFHPRKDAKGKIYRYQLFCGTRSPFFKETHYHLFKPLIIHAMQEAASFLLGTHDFSAFRASDCQRKNTQKNIESIQIEQNFSRGHEIYIYIKGDGFLKNMVRILVGSLALVGKQKYPPSWIQEVLQKKDRTLAGPTFPAHGLFLQQVIY